MAKSTCYCLPFLGLLVLLLVGCEGFTSSENSATTVAKTQQESPKSTGKPGAAVSLKQSNAFYFAEPGLLDLGLQLVTPLSSGNMQVDVVSGRGVGLHSAQSHYEFTLESDTVYSVPLRVQVNNEGRFYINLHINVMRNGKLENKVLTVIVHVGSAQAEMPKNQSLQKVTNSEPGITDLPAQEFIGPAR